MKTPVLYCIFNRLDTVEKTFAPIRDAKPERLYISADGPRSDKEGEKDLTEQVRKYVLDNIDWECDVKTLFREENVGCDYAMASAVEWFFSEEEEGIIVEEDILTSPQFFEFCELMLETYRNNYDVQAVYGSNLHTEVMPKDDYSFFPAFYTSWGWAAWRRLVYPEGKKPFKYKDWYYQKHSDKKYILNKFSKLKYVQKFIEYDLYFETRWENALCIYKLINNPNSYNIISNRNLTSHIGEFSTHFSGGDFGYKPIDDFDVSKIKVKTEIIPDYDTQNLYLTEHFFKNCYKKYGRDNINVKAVIFDYYKTYFNMAKSFVLFLYYRFIKFSKLRAKTQWYMMNSHYPWEKTTVYPFYIYVTKYYNK